MENIINFNNYNNFGITSKFEMLKYLKQVEEQHVNLSLVFVINDQNVYETISMVFMTNQDEIEIEILSSDIKRIDKSYGLDDLTIQAKFELDGVQCLIEFDDLIMKNSSGDRFTSIVLNNISNFIRMQRREYFRVSVPKDEQLFLDMELFNKQTKQKVFCKKVKVLDLSLGGLSLYFEHPTYEDINALINVGDVLENVKLELPQINNFLQNEYKLTLEVKNIQNKKVVSSTSIGKGMSGYAIGLQFVNLSGFFDRHLMILSNGYARKKHLNVYK